MSATDLTPINQYTVFKYIVVGDSGIGKSSLTLRYVENSFEDHSMPTIGIEFFVKHVEYDGNKIRLNIWDTAGQEKYRSITRSYYRLAIGCVLCFSLINRATFNNLKDHLRGLREGCQENIQIVLVGTFLDKSTESLASDKWSVGSLRQVTREEAEQFASENDILYYEEVSAKTGESVNKVFDVLTELVYDNFYEDIANGDNKNLIVVKEINLEHHDGKDRGWCCF